MPLKTKEEILAQDFITGADVANLNALRYPGDKVPYKVRNGKVVKGTTTGGFYRVIGTYTNEDITSTPTTTDPNLPAPDPFLETDLITGGDAGDVKVKDVLPDVPERPEGDAPIVSQTFGTLGSILEDIGQSPSFLSGEKAPPLETTVSGGDVPTFQGNGLTTDIGKGTLEGSITTGNIPEFGGVSQADLDALSKDFTTTVENTILNFSKGIAAPGELKGKAKLDLTLPSGELARRDAAITDLVQRVRDSASSRGLNLSTAGARLESLAVSKFLQGLAEKDFERAFGLAQLETERARFNLDRAGFQAKEEARLFKEQLDAGTLRLSETALAGEIEDAQRKIRADAVRLGLSGTEIQGALRELQFNIDSGKFEQDRLIANFNEQQAQSKLDAELAVFDRRMDTFVAALEQNKEIFSQEAAIRAIDIGETEKLRADQLNVLSIALDAANISLSDENKNFALDLQATGMETETILAILTFVQNGQIAEAQKRIGRAQISQGNKQLLLGALGSLSVTKTF